MNGVKREDDSPDLRFSSVLTSTTPRFKEEGSQQTTEEQSECSNHTEVENICRSLDASITPNLPESSEYRQSEASTSTSALINVRINSFLFSYASSRGRIAYLLKANRLP